VKKKRRSLVEIKNLCLKIKGRLILNNISFSLEYNEIVGVVGESGSGKSLMAHILMGLQPKHSEIIADKLNFLDSDLRNFSPKKWQKYRGRFQGMIFQEPQSSLNPTLKCGKQLREVLSFHRKMSLNEKKERVINTLKEVKLLDTNRIINSYPHQLSGGQKQRVMIAMALLCNPKLLIADEPTTALDVTVQKEILLLLKILQKKYKMSIFFISHDLALIKKFADQVLVMHNGTIIESNNTKDLFKKPKKVYTKGLISTRPKIDKRIERLPTLNDYIQDNFKIKKVLQKIRFSQQKKIYSQKPILEIKHIEKCYLTKSWLGKTKKHKALNNITFSLYPGEILGLVGESGCGKSTLAKTIVCLDIPDSGEIKWKGLKIDPKDKKQVAKLRKEVQFIFQDPYAALHPLKTVGNCILEVLNLHYSNNNKKNHERTISLLNNVGLTEEFIHRYSHELSGGQRQRVIIARALAVDPKVLICDESVAALDISVQAQVLNLLNDLKNNLGLSYLFISHDLSVVKHMSDRVMIMREGEIIEIQEADQLYRNPKNNYTKKLIEAVL